MDMFDTIGASETGAWLHLINPQTNQKAFIVGDDGKEDRDRPIRIQLYGPDSPTFRDRMKRRAAEAVRDRGSRREITKMTDSELMALFEEQEESAWDDAADATMGWENLISNGEPVEFSRAASRDLYKRYPNILRQVQAFREGEANFFAKG